jgi:hypothetical protein
MSLNIPARSKIEDILMRFEVLTAVKISMLVFWVVNSCGLLGRYRRFGDHWCLPSSPRGLTTQKTNIDKFNNVRLYKNRSSKTRIRTKIKLIILCRPPVPNSSTGLRDETCGRTNHTILPIMRSLRARNLWYYQAFALQYIVHRICLSLYV